MTVLTSRSMGWDLQLVYEGFQEFYKPISNALTALGTWNYNEFDTSINILETLYSFYDYMEIYFFLKENSYLLPLLFEAHTEINRYFPEGTKMSLKVVDDLDLNGVKMFILINSPTNLDKSFELLDLVDENWWADAILNAKFKLNIDLEY